jgi:hypothetical protein
MESQPYPALGVGSVRYSFNPKVDVSACILDHLSKRIKHLFDRLTCCLLQRLSQFAYLSTILLIHLLDIQSLTDSRHVQ